jgi:hypothetical protein
MEEAEMFEVAERLERKRVDGYRSAIQLDLKFFDVGCTVEYLCSLLEAAVVPDVHRQALELLEDEGCGIGPRGYEIQYVEVGEGVVGLDGFEMDIVNIGMDA